MCLLNSNLLVVSQPTACMIGFNAGRPLMILNHIAVGFLSDAKYAAREPVCYILLSYFRLRYFLLYYEADYCFIVIVPGRKWKDSIYYRSSYVQRILCKKQILYKNFKQQDALSNGRYKLIKINSSPTYNRIFFSFKYGSKLLIEYYYFKSI